MNTKTLLAGLAAGVAMFFWGALSHMVLPLGNIGIQTLQEEAAVTAMLKDNVKAPGLYMYPYSKDEAVQQQLIRERPRGILTFTSNETPFNLGASLGVQCLNDLVCGLILAWILVTAGPGLSSLGAKLCFASVVASLGSVGYLGAFWNWYGFPASFALATSLDSIVAACIGTLVISKIAK